MNAARMIAAAAALYLGVEIGLERLAHAASELAGSRSRWPNAAHRFRDASPWVNRRLPHTILDD